MIIGTYEGPLEIGRKYGTGDYEDVSDKDNNSLGPVPFLVVREATLEEYLKQCKELGAGVSLSVIPKDARFYEVLMD